MRGKVRELFRQFRKPCTFERLIIGGGADVHGNILTELLRQSAAGICAGPGQKLLVLQHSALLLDIVQGVLERYLGIGACPHILRNGGLHRLKIQKIQGIAQLPEKVPDSGLVHIGALILQRILDLPELLFVGNIRTTQ